MKVELIEYAFQDPPLCSSTILYHNRAGAINWAIPFILHINGVQHGRWVYLTTLISAIVIDPPTFPPPPPSVLTVRTATFLFCYVQLEDLPMLAKRGEGEEQTQTPQV